MKIKEIFKYVDFPEIYEGRENCSVSSVTINSKNAEKNSLFIAQEGSSVNSHKFIEDVLKTGSFILQNKNHKHSRPLTKEEESRIFYVENTSQILAKIAKAFYQDPDEDMSIIGITGTNGKTTTSFMCRSIFKEFGWKVGSIGTIANFIGDKKMPSINTTPDGLELYRLLSEMKKEGCKVVVLEISSHALALKRCDLLQLDIAIFTNLSLEHLDFHKTLEEYFKSKCLIFNLLKNSKKTNKLALFNGQSQFHDKLENLLKNQNFPYKSFGVLDKTDKNSAFNFKATIESLNLKGSEFQLEYEGTKESINLFMPGRFNVENALGAIASSLFLGVSMEAIKKALETVKVTGRFQNITPKEPFCVIVDYSHTPDALEKIIKNALLLNPNKIITVFGAGGDRDTSKRPLMGEVSATHSHISILTSDNPRTEDPFAILDDIEKGILKVLKNSPSHQYHKEINRKHAIHKALELAEDNDIVIIAGKGHEEYQIFKTKTTHFSDQEVVTERLKEKKLTR